MENESTHLYPSGIRNALSNLEWTWEENFAGNEEEIVKVMRQGIFVLAIDTRRFCETVVHNGKNALDATRHIKYCNA
jgi:hypothetical protein